MQATMIVCAAAWMRGFTTPLTAELTSDYASEREQKAVYRRETKRPINPRQPRFFGDDVRISNHGHERHYRRHPNRRDDAGEQGREEYLAQLPALSASEEAKYLYDYFHLTRLTMNGEHIGQM
jgi:hypothetical protein